LQNLIERGVISAQEGGVIDLPHMFMSGESLSQDVLSVAVRGGTLEDADDSGVTQPREDLFALLSEWQGNDGERIALDTIERVLVESAIARAEGNLSAAARMLGMTRTQVAYRAGKYQAGGGGC
jgi:transcriptional regulator with GAF, ATPase, and Fis domain